MPPFPHRARAAARSALVLLIAAAAITACRATIAPTGSRPAALAKLYRDEVHGFLDERNRIDFYEKLAAFFAQYLAPRAAPQPVGTEENS